MIFHYKNGEFIHFTKNELEKELKGLDVDLYLELNAPYNDNFRIILTEKNTPDTLNRMDEMGYIINYPIMYEHNIMDDLVGNESYFVVINRPVHVAEHEFDVIILTSFRNPKRNADTKGLDFEDDLPL
ncbi:hypothetical protein IMZ31_24325 (plasmid) [Pontibacillus sp. ALD_SL1]|uniref:hypothetical protein n=1 Tax=Pontibacillus sp. ALD_SL1 TaxID=2777185 RepID=UPI001A96FCF3|nr:hypothetical protein [Pontibacillus sp. ALD_SL1]QST02580.1 hypothetical protein IMZ31_24325 [Pontibacillus sp. ALD_SL1]